VSIHVAGEALSARARTRVAAWRWAAVYFLNANIIGSFLLLKQYQIPEKIPNALVLSRYFFLQRPGPGDEGLPPEAGGEL
jgi:hypothetical protein